MSHTFVFYNSPDCMESVIENPFDLASTSSQVDLIYRVPSDLLVLPQYCQPYLDHSYATLSSSPSNLADRQQTVLAIDPAIDQLAAFIDIENVSCNTTVITAPMERSAVDGSTEAADGSTDPWEGSVTRCICNFPHDDGYMICCDRCGVWQHVDCMGVDRNSIPESYLCELCLPRPIDKRRAIRLQMIKKEQMESEMSATDSSSDEVYNGRGSGRKKPGRKRMDGRSYPMQKRPVKRRTSEHGEERTADKRNRPATTSGKVPGARGPRRQSSGESSLRAKCNAAFETDLHVTIDHSVEDVCRNSYTSGVQSFLLAAAVRENEMTAMKLNASTPTNPSLLKEQISKQRFCLVQFGPDVQGVVASESIRVNQAVAEYTGRVLMTEEFDRDNQSDRFVAFVLRYAVPQGISICIDASNSGNDVRYVRCSCMPNAKVVHIVEKGGIRFFVCATKNIAEGREVTIPFHFDFQKSDSEVSCACGRASCQVARFFKQRSSSRPIRVRRSAVLPITEERPRFAATDTLDNGRATGASSGVRQNNRRSVLGKDLSKMVSPDIGADITLMNALAAISTATAFNCTPVPSPWSTVGSTEAQSNGSHSLDTSDDAGDRRAVTSSATRSCPSRTKEAPKGDMGKRMPSSSSRSRSQQLPAIKPEAVTNRIAPIRSNRLRDKAQQMPTGKKE